MELLKSLPINIKKYEWSTDTRFDKYRSFYNKLLPYLFIPVSLILGYSIATDTLDLLQVICYMIFGIIFIYVELYYISYTKEQLEFRYGIGKELFADGYKNWIEFNRRFRKFLIKWIKNDGHVTVLSAFSLVFFNWGMNQTPYFNDLQSFVISLGTIISLTTIPVQIRKKGFITQATKLQKECNKDIQDVNLESEETNQNWERSKAYRAMLDLIERNKTLTNQSIDYSEFLDKVNSTNNLKLTAIKSIVFGLAAFMFG